MRCPRCGEQQPARTCHDCGKEFPAGTTSGAVSELVEIGLVVDTGERRCGEVVWVAASQITKH